MTGPVRRILLAGFLGVAFAGNAAAREQTERLLFDVMVGGLHIADVVISMDQTPDSYVSRLEMKTRGVLEWVQDFSADMRTEGGFTRDQNMIRPAPALYQRQWNGPEMAAVMTMTFDPLSRIGRGEERLFNPQTGIDLKPEDMPWNNRRQPIPVVPDDQRVGAMDPISAFIGARRLILESGEREVRMPIYDGRRRYDIISTVGTPRAVTVRNVERMLTPVASRVEPVFGFDPDGEDRMRESEGQLYFTADERFLPVQLVLGNSMFSSAMNLVAECNVDPAPCDNFGRASETDAKK